MAEIEENRKTVTTTDGAVGSSLTESAEIVVVVRSMQQARMNAMGLRDFVAALNAADAPQETQVDFLEGSLQQLTATWTKTETQTKKKPVYRQMNSGEGGRD